MRRPDRHFIAAYEIASGVFFTAFLLNGWNGEVKGWLSVLQVTLLLVALGSVVVGVLLWRDRPDGYYWSWILQLLQVPHLVIPGMAYGLVMGAELTVALKNGGALSLAANYRAGIIAYFDMTDRPLELGINLWTAWLAFHLTVLQRHQVRQAAPASGGLTSA